MAASTRSSTPVGPGPPIAARSARGRRLGPGRGVHHRPPQLIGVGIEEFELGKLLGTVLQQPGMVDRRHQDQRLAGRQRRAVPAHDRACGQPRAWLRRRFAQFARPCPGHCIPPPGVIAEIAGPDIVPEWPPVWPRAPRAAPPSRLCGLINCHNRAEKSWA